MTPKSLFSSRSRSAENADPSDSSSKLFVGLLASVALLVSLSMLEGLEDKMGDACGSRRLLRGQTDWNSGGSISIAMESCGGWRRRDVVGRGGAAWLECEEWLELLLLDWLVFMLRFEWPARIGSGTSTRASGRECLWLCVRCGGRRRLGVGDDGA